MISPKSPIFRPVALTFNTILDLRFPVIFAQRGDIWGFAARLNSLATSPDLTAEDNPGIAIAYEMLIRKHIAQLPL